MEKQNTCIKAIPYHDVLALRELLRKFDSWQEPLKVVEHYFAYSKGPVNKKQILREYYACSQLFQTFQKDYKRLVAVGEGKISQLEKAEKVVLNDTKRN